MAKSKQDKVQSKESWDPFFAAKLPVLKDGPYDPFKALPKAKKSQDDF